MKKWFLSFADSRMSRALNRINAQAINFRFYDEIITLDERGLDPIFFHQFKDKLKGEVRGFGYWCWKPQVILQVLNMMADGDILQYTDAGCHLNFRGRERLNEYFEIALSAESGILAFQAIAPVFHDNGVALPDLEERKWTKGDLFKYFDCASNQEVLTTQQYGAGIIFIRKCPRSMNFIKLWANAYKDDFTLIDDTPSKFTNFSGFIEHRHDQSIFSILCKLNNVSTLSSYEFWYPSKSIKLLPDWKLLANYPIHVRRDKGAHILMRPFVLIIRIIKRLRFEYLKRIVEKNL